MLALICGTGRLPAHIAAAQPEPPLVCALNGFAPADLAPDMTFRLEQLGTLFADLRGRGVTDICLCGAIRRPPVDPSALDAATLPLVPRMMDAMGQGDDAALRVVIDLFEEQGFTVIAAQDAAPSLLVPKGSLTLAKPTDAMIADAEKGIAILDTLAQFDTGQACVMGGGQLLGLETLGGTDHMLATLPDAPARATAILVKTAKHSQDRRVDWPTIGPETIDAAMKANITGIALTEGGALMLDRDAMLARADEAGIAIWARPA